MVSSQGSGKPTDNGEHGSACPGIMGVMATIPESSKNSLDQRLNIRAPARWPQINRVATRFRGSFAYVTAHLTDGDELALMRLKYAGSARTWGFAIYRASHNEYDDSWLPDGHPAGSPEDALDTVCGLYLTNPPPGSEPPTSLQACSRARVACKPSQNIPGA